MLCIVSLICYVLEPTKQYLSSPTVVRCRGIDGIKSAKLMTMIDKDLYVSWRPDQIEVRL